MYNHNYNTYDQTSGSFGQLDPSDLSTLKCDFDSIQEMTMLGDGNAITSNVSGCTSSYLGSPSSPINCTSDHPPHFTNLFQRSLSCHSLHKNEPHPLFSNPSLGISSLDLGTVKKVSITGDVEQGMTQPCRYSPEEKKERIEKYRSKRSQRNFNKKIQYACRKTLADSRPRVRGRFARNDELEQQDYSQDVQWTQMSGEEDEDDEERWIHLLDSIPPVFDP